VKKGQNVSPGVVIVALVVVILVIGFLFYRGMNRTAGSFKPPEGKTPMMGPMGMMKMQDGKASGAQQNAMPGAPTPAGN